jgi:hypothetical protein
LVCPQSARENAKKNANLNADNSIVFAAIIRVAPLFAGDGYFFGFAAPRRKSKRLVQGHSTA